MHKSISRLACAFMLLSTSVVVAQEFGTRAPEIPRMPQLPSTLAPPATLPNPATTFPQSTQLPNLTIPAQVPSAGAPPPQAAAPSERHFAKCWCHQVQGTTMVRTNQCAEVCCTQGNNDPCQ